jgi:hypothetical protein
MMNTHMLETAEADIAYDVHGPLPTAGGRPPLFMIGQPMDASGFATLASHFRLSVHRCGWDGVINRLGWL